MTLCLSIQWDCDGVAPRRYGLPETLVISGLPATIDTLADYADEKLADILSDHYGWLVSSFQYAIVNETIRYNPDEELCYG